MGSVGPATFTDTLEANEVSSTLVTELVAANTGHMVAAFALLHTVFTLATNL